MSTICIHMSCHFEYILVEMEFVQHLYAPVYPSYCSLDPSGTVTVYIDMLDLAYIIILIYECIEFISQLMVSLFPFVCSGKIMGIYELREE